MKDTVLLRYAKPRFSGVAAHMQPHHLTAHKNVFLTDYFNNYGFSKTQIISSLIMVIELKHVGAVLM